MWRKIRIAILLLILLFVALNTYFDRVYSTDWDIPLRVALYPINGDGSDASERFISRLSSEDFQSLEAFFDTEAMHYGVKLDRPVRFTLAAQLRELPPMIEPGSSTLAIVAWSLKTRYWTWRVAENPAGAAPDVKLFLLYHDPEQSHSLPHSVGLQKGLFGIVNAFADRRMQGANDTVTAHELLHTLGATDKYELSTSQPLLPDGYAEPQREPLYPQTHAELMGGRIPQSAEQADIPQSLSQVVIGRRTAEEIGWAAR